MYEIWTKSYGVVAEAENYTEGVRVLKEYAAEAGVSFQITFTGGYFRDPDGILYVLRKSDV